MRSYDPNCGNSLDVVYNKLKVYGSKAFHGCMTVEAARDVLTVMAADNDDLRNLLDDARNALRHQVKQSLAQRVHICMSNRVYIHSLSRTRTHICTCTNI